jgi:N-formylglutamate amidohydrolase
MEAAASFEVFPAMGRETPVVVEVPHAGLCVPPEFTVPMAAPVRALGRDADVFVDALYADAPAEGATLLVARTSRFVIDLNRAEGDVDADVVESAARDVRFNHGLVWRVTSDGDKVLSRALTRAELEERLARVYRPYHAALREALDAKHARFGVAVLLAAHSMPGLGKDVLGAQAARADVVPGTRGRTSADGRFIDVVEALARARGWSVRHDDPYAGGYSTQHYGKPRAGVHAVQVELSRRLYADEAALRPRPEAFDAVRVWCRELVRRLGAEALAAGATGPAPRNPTPRNP